MTHLPGLRHAAALILALGLPLAAHAEGGGSLAQRVAEAQRIAARPAVPAAASAPVMVGPAVVRQAMLHQPASQAQRRNQPQPGADGASPAMRWGSRGSDAWTRELLAALDSHGGRLVQTVPGDVASYCPGYVTASTHDRAAFWAGLVSSIAKHESTWNPKARGGGGKWLGLMQIAPSTWRAHGCNGQILDGGDNLSCAVRIMAKQVGRDGVIAGGGARGVGRDWAPMRSGAKRADIAGWTRQQSYCR